MKTKKNSDIARVSICSVLLLLLVLWFITSGIQAADEAQSIDQEKDQEDGIHSNYA